MKRKPSVGLASTLVVNWLADSGVQLTSAIDFSQFERLCKWELPLLTGHTAMFAALGGRSGAQTTWNFGFSVEQYEALGRAWNAHHAASPKTSVDSSWLRALGHSACGPGAAQAAVVSDGLTTSALLVMGMPESRGAQEGSLLRLVAPFFHIAMTRLSSENGAAASSVKLTRRERELLSLVARGHTNPQIADEWSRSVATVRNQMHHLMRKLGVNSRAQLVAMAVGSGLLELARIVPPI